MLIHPMAERLRGLGLAAMADAFLDMHNQLESDSKSRGCLVVPGNPADKQESHGQHEPSL